jgi:hypothetical protein
MIDSVSSALPLDYGRLDAAKITKIATEGVNVQTENGLNMVKVALETREILGDIENSEDILAQLLNG